MKLRFAARLIRLLAIVILSAGLITSAAVQAQDDTASWTIMQYSIADTDLEEPMLLDVNEMEWVGSTDEVNMVVQIDRAEGYTDADGDWTEVRRYFLTQDQDAENLGSPPVETLGELNMGDPDVLVDFVTWVVQNYPADRYALILSDHGSGWYGFGGDESTDDYDSLTMQELGAALDEITANLDIRFEIIGFDACLMNQFEVAKMLSAYANYAVLAEETEPGFGWSYDTFLAALVDNPAMDGAELGRHIVDTYMYFYTEIVTYYDVFDLSVLDLSKVGGVDTAMNGFVRAVQANAREVLSAIGDARINAQTFGGSTNPDEAEFFSSVDLIHFLDLLTQLSPNAEVTSAATALKNAASDMVIYQQANQALSGARGLAIYFPRNQRVYDEIAQYYDYNQQIPYLADWQAFLNIYYGVAIDTIPPSVAATTQAVKIQAVYPGDVVSIHKPPVVQFDLNGQDILEVSFSATLVLDDGTQIMLDQSPLVLSVLTEEGEQIQSFPDGLSQNEFTWGVEMPVISDGENTVDTLLIFNRNDPNSAAVSGTYIPQSGDEVKANLIFDLETGQVSSVWGVSETSAPYEIRTIRPGDQFLPSWRFLDENKEYVIVPANTDPLIFGDEPFTFAYAPADSGTYVFTIRVEDIAGNLYTDSAVITVDNEGLDTSYRGFTDVTFGLNFLYPWEWPEPSVTEDGTQIIISDPGQEINIYVNAYDVASNEEILDTLDEYLAGFELDELVVNETVPVTAGGFDGSVVSYTFSQEGQSFIGAVLAVYVPDNQTGYILDFDAVESLSEEGTAAFNKMLESLNFFAPTVAPETPASTDTANICFVTGSGANVRAEPDTSASIVRVLTARAEVDGQTVGTDGYVWWHLAAGGWVRSDVVTPGGSCENMPAITGASGTGQPATTTTTTTTTADTETAIRQVFAELGYTDADIQGFLTAAEITMADLVTWIDNNELTLDELRDILEGE